MVAAGRTTQLAGLTHAVPAQGEVGMTIHSAFHEIGGGNSPAVRAQNCAAAAFRDDIVGDQRSARAPRDRHCDCGPDRRDEGLPTSVYL